MAINSREKGARGERELAKKLREYGYTSRRGQQYSGKNGDADVVGLPGIHIECKRVERLNLDMAMSQAIGDAKEGKFPAVFHRKNNEPWLVTMRLDDWIDIYREWEAGQDERIRKLSALEIHTGSEAESAEKTRGENTR